MSEVVHDFYDRSFKDLFSRPEMVRDLLTGFVQEDFIDDIDFSKLQKLGTTYILEEYEKRETDLILKLNIKGQEAYLYILIELQSTPDKFIALRVLEYLIGFYQDLLKQKENLPDKLPPVFPIVLYTGKDPFNCAVSIEELIDKPYKRLMKYIPRFEYYKIAINEVKEGKYGELIELENIVAACFNVVRAKTKKEMKEALYKLREIVRKYGDYLQRALDIWLKKFLEKKGVDIEKITLIGGKEMIDEVIDQIYEEGKEKGIAEGKEKGIAEGIEKGKEQGKLEMIKKFSKKGFSLEELAKITELSVEELKKLLAE
ncbi:MAG: Rpn family recombination-promoting nuclease/putative transposase [Candidatus Eremiobacterota bacterium]